MRRTIATVAMMQVDITTAGSTTMQIGNVLPVPCIAQIGNVLPVPCIASSTIRPPHREQ
jgi:hypothetical protein